MSSDILIQKNYEEKTRLFGNMNFLPADEFKEIYEKTHVDVDGRIKLLQNGRRDMVRIVKEYVQFTQGIPNFKALSPKDQSTLLKGSLQICFCLPCILEEQTPEL